MAVVEGKRIKILKARPPGLGVNFAKLTPGTTVSGDTPEGSLSAVIRGEGHILRGLFTDTKVEVLRSQDLVGLPFIPTKPFNGDGLP